MKNNKQHKHRGDLSEVRRATPTSTSINSNAVTGPDYVPQPVQTGAYEPTRSKLQIPAAKPAEKLVALLRSPSGQLYGRLLTGSCTLHHHFELQDLLDAGWVCRTVIKLTLIQKVARGLVAAAVAGGAVSGKKAPHIAVIAPMEGSMELMVLPGPKKLALAISDGFASQGYRFGQMLSANQLIFLAIEAPAQPHVSCFTLAGRSNRPTLSLRLSPEMLNEARLRACHRMFLTRWQVRCATSM